MAEECGDKDLVRAAGGQTADKPCGGVAGLQVYCNLPDVNAWQARVAELKSMMVATWNRLFDIEGAQGDRKHTAEGSELRTWWERIDNHISNVDEVPWYGIGDKAAAAVAAYVGIAQDQACIIETMRLYIKAAGGKPPKLPHFKPAPRLDVEASLGRQVEIMQEQIPRFVTGLLIIGGIAATAYVLRPVIAQQLLLRKARSRR